MKPGEAEQDIFLFNFENLLQLPNGSILGRGIYLINANILGGNSGSPEFLKPVISRPFMQPGKNQFTGRDGVIYQVDGPKRSHPAIRGGDQLRVLSYTRCETICNGGSMRGKSNGLMTLT